MADLSPFQFHVLNSLANFGDDATRTEIRAQMRPASGQKYNKGWAKECGASTKRPLKPNTLEGRGLIVCTTPDLTKDLRYKITPLGRAALRSCKQF